MSGKDAGGLLMNVKWLVILFSSFLSLLQILEATPQPKNETLGTAELVKNLKDSAEAKNDSKPKGIPSPNAEDLITNVKKAAEVAKSESDTKKLASTKIQKQKGPLKKEKDQHYFGDLADHRYAFVKKHGLTIAIGNVAQQGKLNAYPDKETALKWSSTLRTADIMTRLTSPENKSKIAQISNSFKEIIDSAIDVEKKAEKIKDISQSTKKTWGNMGLKVKEIVYKPSKFFNNLPFPSFVIENFYEFSNRMRSSFESLFAGSANTKRPGIVTTQEVELGDKTKKFDNFFSEIAEKYKYGMILPSFIPEGEPTTCSVTFYDKKIYSNLVDDSKIQEIEKQFRDLFKLSKEKDPTKLTVAALQDKKTKKVIYVINIHANYGVTNNNPDIYPKLKTILDTTPNLIVAGDFNIQEKNKEWFNDFNKDKFLIWETPDILDKTLDGIFFSSQMD